MCESTEGLVVKPICEIQGLLEVRAGIYKRLKELESRVEEIESEIHDKMVELWDVRENLPEEKL